MQPHEQRVIEEREQLVSRLDKLTEFLKGDLFKGLPADEQERLARQHRIMGDYAGILAERIVQFG